MIVKTGANYHAEGGYIEASKAGADVNIKIDGENYHFKSDAEVITSLYKVGIRTAPEFTNTIFSIGLRKEGDKFTPITSNVTNANMDRYASETIAIFIAIGGTTGLTNPVLADGSHNTMIIKQSDSVALIYAIGPDAVAIIKEAD